MLHTPGDICTSVRGTTCSPRFAGLSWHTHGCLHMGGSICTCTAVAHPGSAVPSPTRTPMGLHPPLQDPPHACVPICTPTALLLTLCTPRAPLLPLHACSPTCTPPSARSRHPLHAWSPSLAAPQPHITPSPLPLSPPARGRPFPAPKEVVNGRPRPRSPLRAVLSPKTVPELKEQKPYGCPHMQ